ncbi:YoaK family protein [Myxococcus sp. Y35]|uniref:YoaK family protein n=1 Tax=Pseudomyxococcus flavus TaxID=3115648 RepID=UPI003CF4051D
MPFSSESSPGNRRAYTLLSLLLAGVAGLVNATGFVALGLHTSHMSGNMATLGESLASGNGPLAWLAAQLLLAFLLGAVSASALLELSRQRSRGRHSAALLLEALTLGGIGAWLASHPGAREPTLMWGLAYAMGLQNALVTRVSGAVVRTTHITGIITDVGIQLVRLVSWLREGARGHGVRGLRQRLGALPTAIEFERTRLHLGLGSAFLLGCTAGPLLFVRLGAATLALPCAVLVLLVALDLSAVATGSQALPRA